MLEAPSRPLVFTLELLAWGGCVLLGGWMGVSLMESDFPGRSRALLGVLAGTGFSAIAAYTASTRRHGTTLTTALSMMRMVVGVPMMVFWLVVAGAGFAA